MSETTADELKHLMAGAKAFKGASLATASAKVFSSALSYIGDIDPAEFQKLVEDVSAVKVAEYSITPGMKPKARRVLILSKMTVEMMKLLIATTETRGHQLSKYAERGTDKLSGSLKGLVTDLDIKRKSSGKMVGLHSVVAIKTSVSDFYIAFCEKRGAARFGDQKFKGALPHKYQFLGSLSAIYLPEEDTDGITVWPKYCKMYEEFQDWYINVRTEAAKARGSKKSTDAAKVENAKNFSRRFYVTALCSWSREQRKQWSELKYKKEVEEGDSSQIQNNSLAKAIYVSLGTTEEKVMSATNPVNRA